MARGSDVGRDQLARDAQGSSGWPPREMHDKLGLDYKLADGSHPFTPDQEEIHVLRHTQDDPSDIVVPRHEKPGGDGGYDDAAMDPENPFTGTGYTSGGIPEFHTGAATDLPLGSGDLADGQLGWPGARRRAHEVHGPADVDAGPVMRSSGLYAVLAGETVHVKMHDSDYVYVAGPYRLVQHEMDELDDLLSVRTSATWRGGRIAVSVVSGDECSFNTTDQRLAEREGLDGDFYNGWHGAAPLDELSDVDERVTSIHPRRREA